MPETPEQLYARVAGALRMPPVEEWETFPFDGDMRPRPLAPPAEADTPRRGEGGVDCDRCGGPDGDFFWTNERWRLRAIGPTGLPLIAILEPRDHFAEPGDLPDELAAELGVLQARIERAIRGLGRHRPRPCLPLRRRRRAPPLVVHLPTYPPPAARRQLHRDLGRRPSTGARGDLAGGRGARGSRAAMTYDPTVLPRYAS